MTSYTFRLPASFAFSHYPGCKFLSDIIFHLSKWFFCLLVRLFSVGRSSYQIREPLIFHSLYTSVEYVNCCTLYLHHFSYSVLSFAMFRSYIVLYFCRRGYKEVYIFDHNTELNPRTFNLYDSPYVQFCRFVFECDSKYVD